MKIKDLKQPYREMALIEQEAQGNERNEGMSLNYLRCEGNFDWDCSLSVGLFSWCDVRNGNYPEITPEIKAKFPSVFKDYTVKELIQLFEKYEDPAEDCSGCYYFIRDEHYKKLAEEILEKFINLKK